MSRAVLPLTKKLVRVSDSPHTIEDVIDERQPTKLYVEVFIP
jgi:hypothetical protein